MASKGYLMIVKPFGQYWCNKERMKYVNSIYFKLSIKWETANQVNISVYTYTNGNNIFGDINVLLKYKITE